MQAIRVYKINIKTNILRQVVFTDRNIFLGLSGLILFGIWKLAGNIGQDLKVLISITSIGTLLIIVSTKIDRQPLLIIARRGLNYFRLARKVRY